jgi:c-di-GMP phosphodiesterase
MMGISQLSKTSGEKSFLRDMCVAGICASALSIIATIGHDSWLTWHNKKSLQSLAVNAIKQAEYNLDYATLAAFEVAEKAPEPCTPAGQSVTQAIVHGGSNIKDVITLGANGEALCNTFPSSEREVAVSLGIAMRNDSFALHRLSAVDKDTVGISWKAEDHHHILIALDLDAQLFAAMPAEIRDDARNSLSVTGLGEISSFGREIDPQKSVTVSAFSDRFPVSTTLTLDMICFNKWNGENRTLIGWLGALLGGLVGGLLVRELHRPLSPRQVLEKATSNGEIQPFAQATFDLATRQITGCEILMRWIKPNGEIVSPAHFIPLAEATNMIVPMTRHVIKSALAQFASHLNKNREFRIAFNVVPADFATESFAYQMLQLTKEAGVATRQVVLEITERQATENLTSLRAAHATWGSR